jgi:hypothetical protein
MFEQMPTKPAELTEARALIGRLAAAFETMKPGDQRLWRSWRCYLCRRGCEARIGPHRLKLLRQLGADYDAVEGREAA